MHTFCLSIQLGNTFLFLFIELSFSPMGCDMSRVLLLSVPCCVTHRGPSVTVCRVSCGRGSGGSPPKSQGQLSLASGGVRECLPENVADLK